MKSQIDKEKWIALFHEIGVNKDQMKMWHGHFEKKYPEAHESFLAWLGLESGEIQKIREESAR